MGPSDPQSSLFSPCRRIQVSIIKTALRKRTRFGIPHGAIMKYKVCTLSLFQIETRILKSYQIENIEVTFQNLHRHRHLTGATTQSQVHAQRHAFDANTTEVRIRFHKMITRLPLCRDSWRFGNQISFRPPWRPW